MLFDPKHDEQLDALEAQASSCRFAHARSHLQRHRGCLHTSSADKKGWKGSSDRSQLIDAGALIDATLALIELELPAWKLRRLVYEDGEWHCSLSRHPNLPVALVDTANASHEVLPLAILAALIEAHRMMNVTCAISLQTVPRARSTSGYAICCDNFS